MRDSFMTARPMDPNLVHSVSETDLSAVDVRLAVAVRALRSLQLDQLDKWQRMVERFGADGLAGREAKSVDPLLYDFEQFSRAKKFEKQQLAITQFLDEVIAFSNAYLRRREYSVVVFLQHQRQLRLVYWQTLAAFPQGEPTTVVKLIQKIYELLVLRACAGEDEIDCTPEELAQLFAEVDLKHAPADVAKHQLVAGQQLLAKLEQQNAPQPVFNPHPGH